MMRTLSFETRCMVQLYNLLPAVRYKSRGSVTIKAVRPLHFALVLTSSAREKEEWIGR